MANLPPITIWIHGTLPEHLIPSIFSGITIESVHNFFYCKPGLTKAAELEPKYQHYQFARTLSTQQPTLFPFDTFYIYGWPGTLDSNERLRSAHLLYQEIQKLSAAYTKKHGQSPIIRIITHSHGGNVALNLARAHQEYTNGTHDFIIHELILLAIPVQEETAHYINDPLFTSVYSLHSHWDILQIGDPQGWSHIKQTLTTMVQANSFEEFKKALESIELRNLFSERHFTTHNTKLLQANITHEHIELFHIEFLLLSFIRQLPGIMDQLRQIMADKNHPAQEVTITIPSH
ncbi:MAG: hypothetical protein ACHQVS_00335 [Candidatus Babeliales bacterium]